jgi:predicted O-methyltransferase YrrM
MRLGDGGIAYGLGVTAGAYSIPEVQRLLATLVASKPGGRVAEIGTAYGEGARAIAAALPAGATFVTVEIDGERAAHAREELAGTPAEVLEGDWHDLLPQRGPFDLVFADGGRDYELVIDLLAPGGIVVKDDLSPDWPDKDRDPTRRALLADPRVEAIELLVRHDMAVIVAVRRS